MKTAASGVSVRERVVQGRHGPLPVREYRPSHATGSAPLVWVHGGGFSSGGLDQRESDAPARALAARGRAVLTVDYRLAPKWPFRGQITLAPSPNRFPVPVDDVIDAYRDFAEREGAAPYLGGASAGACLSASAAQRLTGDPMRPPGLLLLYGIFHAALPPLSPHLRSRVRGVHGVLQFRPDTVHRMNLNYAGSEEALGDTRTFPGGGDVGGLPPTLLLDADRDTLRASGEAFAAELERSGVDVVHRIVAGSTHGFLDRPRSASFREGLDVMHGWLSDR